mmetsp:Transcript_33165/g.48630  ORF Transcript_33165/g.48630 Transcript_33165/m.48630 type:complete len:225 (-) Transcript_33165:652-1326(-)
MEYLFKQFIQLCNRRVLACCSRPNTLVNFTLLFPELNRARIQLPRQGLDTIFRDQQGVFKLRRPLAIHSCCRPLIRPSNSLRNSLTNHGFNRKRMSRSHLAIRFVIGIMQNVRCGVKHTSNSMTAKVSDRGKTVWCHVIFNDTTYVFVISTGLNVIQGSNPTIVGDLKQLFGVVINFSDTEHFRAVAMVPVEITCNVNVDDITLHKFAIVWDAVADNFIDGSAT